MTRVTDIDALISTWMSEGPEHAPERRSRLAIDEIAATPQRRSRPWLGGAASDDVRRPWRLLAAVAATIVLATSLGVAVRAGLIRLPSDDPVPAASMLEQSSAPEVSPDPSPRTAPSVDPEEGLQNLVAPDGTFQIQLPRSWARGLGVDRTALYLVKGEMELSIRAGDDQEQLRTCDTGAGPWETCDFVTATTLDELADTIGLTGAPEVEVYPLGPTRTSTTMDGQPARIIKIEAYEHPAAGNEFVTYVVAMFDGRPFIIRIWTPSGAGIDDDLTDILDGFTFRLGADPDVEDGVRTFKAPDGSFEIQLPQEWHVEAGPDLSAVYLYRSATRVSIRAGDADGRILTCDAPQGPWEECVTSTPRTLTELGRDITLTPTAEEGIPPSGPTRSDAVLDGEPARIERIEAWEYPGKGGEWVTYVGAMHEGRPFVIRFWSPSQAPDTAVEEILAGFQFLDN